MQGQSQDRLELPRMARQPGASGLSIGERKLYALHACLHLIVWRGRTAPEFAAAAPPAGTVAGRLRQHERHGLLGGGQALLRVARGGRQHEREKGRVRAVPGQATRGAHGTIKMAERKGKMVETTKKEAERRE